MRAEVDVPVVVGMLGVLGESGMTTVPFQTCEVQSSFGVVKRSITAGGIEVGYLLACEKKHERLLLDCVSARTLFDPGR